MRRWALIRDGVVVDVALGPDDLPQLLSGYGDIVDIDDPQRRMVRTGWRYSAGTFSEPLITLADAKRAKAKVVWHEAMLRITQIYPELGTRGSIEPLLDLWLSIAPAARQPNATWSAFVAILAVLRTALAQIRSATTTEEVDGITWVWPA